MNHFSLLSDKMHAMTTFFILFCHTSQLAKHYTFSAHFSIANTLLSKLIKAHSNQSNDKQWYITVVIGSFNALYMGVCVSPIENVCSSSLIFTHTHTHSCIEQKVDWRCVHSLKV